MFPTKPIELLAPAKDLECGYAAINSGADAVYIGAPRFGARENAGNPLSDIAQLTAYAHQYWVKVYVVLNTLLYDHEVSEAVHTAHKLHEIGVDALIIQDFALLENDLPAIPLIASTQMHNNTPERVSFLEQIGFQRAILARELDLGEIKAIRAATQIELEVFVHGALCVSYSGQCYMSYAIGGRSGNRGQCAQPCRRTYSLVDGNNKVLVSDRHLLSLKDLNRLDDLEDLLAIGVTSFKIEGRLKDQAYVSNVVGQYRLKLDDLLAKHNLKASSSGKAILDFSPDVNKTFNRGYTSYFLRERNTAPGSLDTPKMLGESMGYVKEIHKSTIILNEEHQWNPGDGVCWFDNDNRLQGTNVNKVAGQSVTLNQTKGIVIGVQVYRNHDHAFLTKLQRSQPQRKIDVSFTLNATETGFRLIAVDSDGNQGTTETILHQEEAVKAPEAISTIHKQLARTGNTPFQCTKIVIDCPFTPFIPSSILNQLRRNVLEALVQERLLNRPISLAGNVSDPTVNYPEENLDYRHNVLNQSAERYLKRHGVKTIEYAAENGLNMNGRMVMRTRQCIKRQLGWCKDQSQKGLPEKALYLSDENGQRYTLIFDCEHCEMEIMYGS